MWDLKLPTQSKVPSLPFPTARYQCLQEPQHKIGQPSGSLEPWMEETKERVCLQSLHGNSAIIE